MGKIKRNNQYERLQGKRPAIGNLPVSISFSWNLDVNQGQTTKEWEEDGLLSDLIDRLQQIGKFSKQEALARQLIKQYTKLSSLPENSEFSAPRHINPPEYWAVIHIKDNSKAVVAGYLEDDVFHIVFLDKNHVFWKTDLQSRGKNRR